jgi:hypothetical protein
MLSQTYELKHLADHLQHNIRRFMLQELLWSFEHKAVYLSKYLTEAGRARYPQLLAQALDSGSPNSLSDVLNSSGLWQDNAPRNSIATFAWDEFNKHYMRGLCRWIQEHPGYTAVVVRGRHSGSPRSSSDAKINQPREAAGLLQQLRHRPAINPFGANSGLTLTIRESGAAARVSHARSSGDRA